MNFVIVLVRPQLPQNIGAVARAMKNFCFFELRIVDPKVQVPCDLSIANAVGAADVLQNAQIYSKIEDALFDVDYVYATTARRRDMNKKHISTNQLPKEDMSFKKAAILFGPENNGLSNEDISNANALISIDTNPEFSSINISQSVILVCYEFYKNKSLLNIDNEQDSATSSELNHFCSYLFNKLSLTNFYKVDEKEDTMNVNIKNIFTRIPKLSKNELKTLYGIISRINPNKQN
jgi:tRNA/rRNA methyltransferase